MISRPLCGAAVLAGVLALVPSASARSGTGVSAFLRICVSGFPGFADIEPALGEAGAWLAETHPDSMPFMPHIIVERRQAWLTGDPETKAPTDLFINRVEGSMDGEPAIGCQVGGYGDITEAMAAEIIAAFDSTEFIATIEYEWTKNSSWVVEKGGRRGLLTLVSIPGFPDTGPGGFSFALEIPPDTVIAKLLPR